MRIALTGGQQTRAHFGIRDYGRHEGHRAAQRPRASPRGASFHEQTRRRGAALMPADRDELVRKLQALGADFARQHYPPHPALLEAFDRAGIVDRKHISVWRVGARSCGRRATAAARCRRSATRSCATATTRRSWRGASRTADLAGAGPAGKNAGGLPRSSLDELDTTRLFAADQSLRPLNDLPAVPTVCLDAIGLNEYVGWYGGRNSQLSGDLAKAHARFPGQVFP